MNVIFVICLVIIGVFAELAILSPIFDQLSIIASGKNKGRYTLRMRTYQHCIDSLVALLDDVPECDRIGVQMAIDELKEIRDERANRQKYNSNN